MASASSTPRQDQSQLPQALTFADIQEQAHAATSRVLESILKGKSFDRTKVADWVGEANRQVTQGLEDLSKNFKYAVNTILMQKTDAALDVATAAHWDVATDGILSVQFANSHLLAVTTVFIAAL